MTDNEILIRAAKRNYNTFKVAVGNVSAKKLKRYYTPEQQADLDIKTSVNKIGEIINLSQELNTLIWEKMYNGATYDDIKDIYYDVCQLNIMSNIEIDAAKREFDVNNSRELDKIRNKYNDELTCEDGRKLMPYFFAHVSKQKGYYNPIRKNYSKCHTSMDYLQTVVNSFRVKTKYNKQWLLFGSILDNKKFRASNVNLEQIKEIYSKTNNYLNETGLLFSSDIDMSEKHKRWSCIQEDFIDDINSTRIGFSTLFYLLRTIEDKDNVKIKNTLLKVLFLCENKSFNKAILNSATELDCIKMGGNDLFLFGIGHSFTKKRQNSVLKGLK